jgi:hypothetical protein
MRISQRMDCKILRHILRQLGYLENINAKNHKSKRRYQI